MNPMKTRNLLLALSCLAGISLVAAEKSPVAPPNILLIVADDLGYSDLGCYGGEIQTPNLDRMAANGLRFTQFYNTARCWPSRSSILTGYYAQAIRRDVLTGYKAGKGGRPCWAQLLPEYLKPLGYRSYHSGKWHIDGDPVEEGFDQSYDRTHGNSHFVSPVEMSKMEKPLQPVKPGDYYCSTAIADYAIRQLRDHADKHAKSPFFEYLAFTEPHFPVQALPEDIALYKDRYTAGWDILRQERYARMKKLGIVTCELSPLDPVTVPSWNLKEEALREKIGPNEIGHAVPWTSLTDGQKKFQSAKMAVHAAMVHRIDIEVGRVLDQLKAMGAIDNTIVLFLSDNGASAEQIIRGGGHDPSAPIGSAKTFLCIGPGWSSAANTPFRLHKSWNHEGGIATPLIVNWPAGIKAQNELRTNPGHLIDIVPTVLELTNGKQPATVSSLSVPPLHGKSLVPAFTQDGSVTRDYLWWNHAGNRAIRIGDWKLVADHTSPWELYDLSKDRSETKNLAAAYPEKAKALEKAWLQHATEFEALSQQDQSSKATGKKGKRKAKNEDE